MSVLWPSKYAKIRFRPGLCPGPHWELTTLPRPPSRLGREHPSPYSTQLDTDLPSALAICPPEVQPDLRLCFVDRFLYDLLIIQQGLTFYRTTLYVPSLWVFVGLL